MSDIIVGFLLDRSGSMMGIWDDAVGGANAFIEEQREVDGRAFLFLSVFDTEYDRVVNGRLVEDVENPLEGISPRGGTALLDSTAKLIQDIEREQRYTAFAPQDVVIVVMTDGYENSSKEFNNKTLSQLIKRKEEDGWKFIYLGANQDSWSTGVNMGFSGGSTFDWAATPEGTRAAYGAVGQSLTAYRTTGMVEDLQNKERVDSGSS